MKGFHLLELLIVLTMIGILTAISLPMYSNHIRHERRLEAATQLTRLAAALEEYHIQHDTYQGASLARLHFPEFIADQNYQLSMQVIGATHYTLIAKALGQQSTDNTCGNLILHETGLKEFTGSGKTEECW